MRLELAQIQCYERNPRRSRNPEYDRIKASIRASGLDQPLRITRRPGAPTYIVQAGGNTRLQILNELYARTGDERFNRIDCVYVQWQYESAVLLAHLRENDLRGDLSFIDRAEAVLEAQALFAEERQFGDVSHRQLEGLLKEHGYSLSHVIISIMDYAVAVLLPVMPVALAAGLGRPQVQRIRGLQRVGGEVWRLRDVGEATEFQEIFLGLCRRYDAIDWQFAPLRQAVEVELAEAAEISIQVMRMEFDCRLSGYAPDIPDFLQETDLTEFKFPATTNDDTVGAAEPEVPAGAGNGPVAAGSLTSAERCGDDTPPAGAVDGELRVVVEIPPRPVPDHGHAWAEADSAAAISLEALRENAFVVAKRLATRQGLGTLIAPLHDVGLGYFVRNTPPSLNAEADSERRSCVAVLWWHLVTFADMPFAPQELLHDRLDASSNLKDAVSSGNWTRLLALVPMPDPTCFGLRFMMALDDAGWQDWLSLTVNCREMHRLAVTEHRPLWELPP
jgi:ParB family protein of integrating conjugative element (PFGI_1 class)